MDPPCCSRRLAPAVTQIMCSGVGQLKKPRAQPLRGFPPSAWAPDLEHLLGWCTSGVAFCEAGTQAVIERTGWLAPLG